MHEDEIFTLQISPVAIRYIYMMNNILFFNVLVYQWSSIQLSNGTISRCRQQCPGDWAFRRRFNLCRYIMFASAAPALLAGHKLALPSLNCRVDGVWSSTFRYKKHLSTSALKEDATDVAFLYLYSRALISLFFISITRCMILTFTLNDQIIVA